MHCWCDYSAYNKVISPAWINHSVSGAEPKISTPVQSAQLGLCTICDVVCDHICLLMVGIKFRKASAVLNECRYWQEKMKQMGENSVGVQYQI